MARPFRCRVHLDDWEPRVDPPTRERYEVCLRCDTYRDRGRSALGAGAAGAGSAGFGGGLQEAAARGRAREPHLESVHGAHHRTTVPPGGDG